MRIAIALLLLASPLQAQDFRIDGHWIDRCTAVQDDPMMCVGRAAEACADTHGGGSDMVIAACRQAEAAFWDRALNEAYGHLQYLARERESWDVGYEPDALVIALRDMQRQWIEYRDAACANAAALSKPFGSAAGPAISECLMIQTARQHFVLRGMRPDYLP